MKKKKRLILFFFLSLVVFGAPLLLMILHTVHDSDLKAPMFSDISECVALEQADAEDLSVLRYDSPKNDKHLKGLSYTSFYAAKYFSDGVDFEIFAYEFESEACAIEYFREASGQRFTEGYSSENYERLVMFRYELVVYDGKRAYRLSSDILPGGDAKIKNFLWQKFSLVIDPAVYLREAFE